MVYDCFQFFNELDILKIRLNVLDSVVDRFVISEATETFSGLKKPLYYEENKEMFAAFADKIIHVVVDDTPKGDRWGTHERDTFQKNAVTRGLRDCTDEDIVIFSDLDEIPNPDKIREICRISGRTGFITSHKGCFTVISIWRRYPEIWCPTRGSLRAWSTGSGLGRRCSVTSS